MAEVDSPVGRHEKCHEVIGKEVLQGRRVTMHVGGVPVGFEGRQRCHIGISWRIANSRLNQNERDEPHGKPHHWRRSDSGINVLHSVHVDGQTKTSATAGEPESWVNHPLIQSVFRNRLSSISMNRRAIMEALKSYPQAAPHPLLASI